MYDFVGADHWTRTTVFELARWKNGLAFKNINFTAEGRPVIKIAELKAGITDQTKFTNAEYNTDVKVQQGDMLFSWSGNPDTSIDVFRWDGPVGWLNQHIYKVHPSENVDDEFLFFLLRSLRPRFAEIARNKQTTGLGHVTLGDFKQMVVGLPSKGEQKSIVAAVGPIEQKIELNRRMNATLEAQARALFRDWFVDFGPVKAKMSGDKPYLAPDLWSLFPNRLDDDGVPEGWATSSLDQIIEFNPREKLTKGEDAPYLAMANLPTRGCRTDNPVRRAFASGSKFRNGDALLARITPCLENGKTAFVDCLAAGIVGWGSTEFIVMRSKPPVPRQVAYLIARDPEFRAAAIQSMSGTSGRQRASVDALAAYPTVIPHDEQVWAVLGSFLDPIFDKIAANAEECHSLSQARDLLLPKLMSGEIRVRESA